MQEVLQTNTQKNTFKGRKKKTYGLSQTGPQGPSELVREFNGHEADGVCVCVCVMSERNL